MQWYLQNASVIAGVASGLLLISESLPFFKKLEANSNWQLVVSLLKKLSGK